MQQETELQMDDEQSATCMNNIFANLTKDYPEIKDEWLLMQCMYSLQLINVESVHTELQKINSNKAPGPYGPHIEILKMLNRLQYPSQKFLMNRFKQTPYHRFGKSTRYLEFLKLSHVRLSRN